MHNHNRQAAWLKSRRQNKKGYEIRSQHDDVVEILIYDVIGFDFWTGGGITAEALVRELQQITAATIRVRINSPGGDAFDGLAIYNALRRHDAHIETHIDGFAASAAATIAMAGDEIFIAENAFLMIHRSWGCMCGNSLEMMDFADILNKLDGSVAKIFVGKSKKSIEHILELMDEETWFTSDEALEEGLVDEITEQVDVDNSFDLSVFSNVPKNLKNKSSLRDEEVPNVRNLERVLRDVGGYSNSEAKLIVSRCKDLSQRDAGLGHAMEAVRAIYAN